MPIDPETRQSLEFLIVQVTKQVEDTAAILDAPDDDLIRKLRLRENQIDVLKHSMKARTLRALRREPDAGKVEADLVQAINVVVDNLESIGDYCNSIAVQVGYLTDVRFFHRFEHRAYLEPVLEVLPRIAPSVLGRAIGDAIQMCTIEAGNDRLFKDHFARITAALRRGESVEDLISSLFILRYLERIGDALLNIGEAIISATVGEPLKYSQFLALEESIEEGLPVAQPELSGEVRFEEDGIVFESVAETRSGCRIGSVQSPGVEGRWAIFKEGDADKLRAERDSLLQWEEAMPELVPRVFHYREEGDKAALLLEMLEGLTFQRIAVDRSIGEAASALRILTGVLCELWNRTLRDGAVSARFTGQLARRIDDVLDLHPRFEKQQVGIGSVELPSLQDTLERMEEIESELCAPFSVLIHGDFNTDNILCDLETDAIHFVDLHRSRCTDYVQDVSVFLVSNFRLPVFESHVRQRLNWVVSEFLGFARRYARDHGDEAFDARLALGLVRSFVTSTRFILAEEFAKVLFLRAIYLMERLIEHSGSPWKTFRLPVDTLAYR